MAEVLKALIADDEPHLRAFLRARLKKLWPELEIVAEAGNGHEALELLEQHQPDVAFLDIQMPGLTGLEVARQTLVPVRVVFVTAFDQYALEAFDEAAVDYLLKPVDDERLSKTIQRLRISSVPTVDPDVIKQVLEQLGLGRIPANAEQNSGFRPEPGVIDHQSVDYLRWLKTGQGSTVRIVSVDEVLFFKADHKYTSVITRDREHLIRKTIKELEQALDPEVFWRVHRSTLVNVTCIDEAKKDFRGRYTLHLKGNEEKLKVSDSYSYLFKQM